MPEFSPSLVVFLSFVGAFTVMTAIRDMRTRRIPNYLTVPMFLAGLGYQAAFHGWAGLADAGLAFALGFGTLLALWLIGGGGGGDVKLMGALSVWLGFTMTLWVMIGSTLLVIIGTFGVIAWSVMNRGVDKTRGAYGVAGKSRTEAAQPRTQRRVMAYAVPVALATWAVVLWQLPRL